MRPPAKSETGITTVVGQREARGLAGTGVVMAHRVAGWRHTAPPANIAPSSEAIAEQLNRILESSEFKRKPSLRDFLQFVVEKTLAGHSHQIKGYTVATEVFGRADNFDNNIDPIVRIQAGRLRRSIERYYSNGGSNDPVRIGIPKGSYVPVFEQVILEVKESEYLHIAAECASSSSPSLAVLPFANLTNDPAEDYFIEGLAQEITVELALCQDLELVPYHLAPALGEQLRSEGEGAGIQCRFALTGSLRKDERQVKVTVHLTDTFTGTQIWGEQYKHYREHASLIQFQEEIALRVAGRIGGAFGAINETLSREAVNKPLEMLTPHDAYLLFYRYLFVPSSDGFSTAFKALEHVLSHDPECGPGWSMLSVLYVCKGYPHSMIPEAIKRQSMSYARKGAALAPRNPCVWLVLALLHFLFGEGDLSLKATERALRLNPNGPEVMGFAGLLMALNGDWERAATLVERGMELNPNYPRWFHVVTCLHALGEGRYDNAYAEAQNLHCPSLWIGPLLRAASVGRLGRTTESRSALSELLRLRPDFITDGPRLPWCYLRNTEMSDLLLDGLSKGGFHMDAETGAPPCSGTDLRLCSLCRGSIDESDFTPATLEKIDDSRQPQDEIFAETVCGST